MLANARRAARGTVLALTTCSPMIGAAVFRSGELAGVRESFQPRSHAQIIPQMVQQLCAACHVSPASLDAIALTIGPGSFTGLRIGVTLVKALTFQRHVPIAAVSSLDVIAYNATSPDLLHMQQVGVCVLLDAKQQKVYAAQYEPSIVGVRRTTSEWLGPPEAWLRRLGKGRQWLIVGDGIAAYGALITRRLGRRAILAPQTWWYPRAVTLGRLGLALLRRGRYTDPITLLPRYLYHKECTVRPGSKSI